MKRPHLPNFKALAKNRLLTDALREIRHTFTRFLSLLVLAALAVCFLSGLRVTAPDMKISADVYFDRQRLMDLRVASTLGLTPEDIFALEDQEGVLEARGAFAVDAILPQGSHDYIVKVLSYAGEDDLNLPHLVQGRLPEQADECLVEPLLLEEAGLAIGDTISLDTGEGAFADALGITQATIVGVADSPLYISVERGSSTLGTGKADAFLILPMAAFTLDYYTDAYLLAQGAQPMETYSDEYDRLTDALADQLEPLAKERAAFREEDAQAQIAKAEDQLAQAEEDVGGQLSHAKEEIDAARKKLDDGWAEYRASLKEYNDGIAKGKADLAAAEKKLTQAQKDLKAGETEYLNGKAQLEAGRSELAKAKVQLEAGQVAYQAQLASYEAGMEVLERTADTQASLQAGAQAAREAAETAHQEAAYQAKLAAQEDPFAYSRVYAQVYADTYDAAYADAYDRAYQTLYNSALSQLLASDQYASLLAAKDQLDQTQAQLEAGEAEYNAGLAQSQQAQRQLSQARTTLDKGWKEYEAGQIDLREGKKTLETQEAQGKQALTAAEQELNDGELEYSKGFADYEAGRLEAEGELNDARKELEQAKRDVKLLEDGAWYVLDRNTNAGYVSYAMDADRIANLATVFPLIFFLVAALVSLTTMTRMVEEQRTTIGGLKALGFSRRSIAVKYVGYGCAASLAGAILGLAVGLTLLPWIICTAYSTLYTIGGIQYTFQPLTSLLAAGAAVGTVTLAALGACFTTLAATPAQLMRPKAPPTGKRILLERLTPLWSRLSFHYKISLRNLFRYKKRFWMTVAGIGGCAALIVTAFGLRGSIMGVMDKQYDEITRYCAQVGLVDQITPLELEEVEKTLAESPLVRRTLPVRAEMATAENDVYTLDCYLQAVPSQQAFEEFVTLRHRTDSQPVTLPDDGVVLTEKMAALMDLSPGDTFTLEADSRVTLTVADVTEHYIQHYVYLSNAYYETVFGQAPQPNAILADFPTDDPAAQTLESRLAALDGVSALSLIQETREIFTSSLESVDYAVILVIVCAAALAFVVLLNLTNINITERIRELATLKVLGFYDRELSAYVYRENVILTILGVAAGMVMGKLLHQWLILTVEIDMLMFGRYLTPSSYLWSALLTTLFSLLVNLTARRKLRDLDMVESLKSVE